jgi:1-acyl-sn-glycerol-3-phosphate acyltransferase
MIRSLWVNLAVMAHSVFFCLLAVVFGFFDRGGTLAHRHVAVPWAKGILWICGVKVQALGRENLDPAVPRLYLSNHQSYFDILGLLACLPANFKFVLKQELMRIPLFGAAMRGAGYISIDRDDPRKALKGMNEAAEKIAGNASVLIFPEGTRSLDGELQSFKPGAFHIAFKARCDMVPIAIVGSGAIIPKGSFRVRKGAFTIRFGRPIALQGRSKKEMPAIMDEVREAMLRLMEEPGIQ